MEALHSHTPLAVVRYSIPVPSDNPLIKYLTDNHTDAVAEIEGRSVTEEGVKVLLYTSKPVDAEGVTPISIEDNLYESSVYEKALVEGRKRENDARIPRIAYTPVIFDPKNYTLETGDTSFTELRQKYTKKTS